MDHSDSWFIRSEISAPAHSALNDMHTRVFLLIIAHVSFKVTCSDKVYFFLINDPTSKRKILMNSRPWSTHIMLNSHELKRLLPIVLSCAIWHTSSTSESDQKSIEMIWTNEESSIWKEHKLFSCTWYLCLDQSIAAHFSCESLLYGSIIKHLCFYCSC